MSLGLQNTKRRIASVNSTKKITKAMELVATAKLKTWKDKMLENYEYTERMVELIRYIFTKIPDLDSPYLKENNVEGKLYIVVTSNLGLCAGYNYNVFRAIDKILKPDDEVLIIGSKGFNHYRRAKVHLNSDYYQKASNLDYATILKIGDYMLRGFLQKKYRSVEFVYTRYVNSLVFIPTTLRLLPIDTASLKTSDDGPRDILMEPNPQAIIKSLIPLYVKSVLYGKMIESQVAEQASRRTAMESATKNAEEINSKLLIEFNKVRQAAITQEITEVIGGANAS